MEEVDVNAATVACEFARVAALCTIGWMTHGCPASAPVCHMNVIGSPLSWAGAYPTHPDGTAMNVACKMWWSGNRWATCPGIGKCYGDGLSAPMNILYTSTGEFND